MSDARLRQDPRFRVLYFPEEAALEDLLAVLLSSGTAKRGVMEVSADLVRKAKTPRGFAEMTPETLLNTPGVGRARAARLLAARELARRMADRAPDVGGGGLRMEELPAWLRERLQHREREYFYQFNFDSEGKLLGRRLASRGGPEEVQIFFREVVGCALADQASQTIVAHNHPRGSSRPSAVDLTAMRSLAAALRQIGVRLLDQLIVGREGVYSCREGRVLRD